MPILLLMLVIGFALLAQARDVGAIIAIAAWCAVVGAMIVLVWHQRLKRRTTESAPSLLDLDQRRRPPRE